MKKKITVRYFAVFRERAGLAQELVTIEADTARDVFNGLKHRHGSGEPIGHCKVAINDELSDWNAIVGDGDTVLLFPPVAGG